MEPYIKINTLFNRDITKKHRPIIEGDFSMPEIEYLADSEWEFTEKVDGTNIRVMFDGETITFGGRSDRSSIPATLVNVLNNMFLPLVHNLKRSFPDGVCLYGEGYGKKIQKGGHLYREDQSFVLFDVKCGDWWLSQVGVHVVGESLGIHTVPMIGMGTLYDAIDMVKAGLESKWGDFLAEGIVARPAIDLFDRGGNRIITKIKSRDFGVTQL